MHSALDSNSSPRVSTSPALSAQNMKASSGLGLCPIRISMVGEPSGAEPEPVPVGLLTLTRRFVVVVEEPALEPSQDLLARERLQIGLDSFFARDAQVVAKRSVGLVQGVVQLEAVEDVVLLLRLVAVAELWIDHATDGPKRVGLVFDPESDALLVAYIVDADERAFGKAAGCVVLGHGTRIAGAGAEGYELSSIPRRSIRARSSTRAAAARSQAAMPFDLKTTMS